MKKLMLLMIVVLGMTFLTGCEEDPPDWDHKASHWEMWISGEMHPRRPDLIGFITTP